jgi:DNA-binding transcriptional regulator GbsR (MarR family)
LYGVYENRRERFVDELAHSAAGAELSAPARRILASLIFEPEPQNLDELAAALGVAKSGVSVAVRELLRAGYVRKLRRPGERRDFYEAPPAAAFWRAFFAAAVEEGVRPFYAALAEAAAALEEAAAREPEGQAAAVRRALARDVRVGDTVLELCRRFVGALADIGELAAGGD